MFGSRIAYAYLVGAAMCWGLGTVLSKYALGGIAAASLLPLQLTCSLLLLGACLLVTRSSLRGIQRSPQIPAGGRTPLADLRRQNHVTHLERF